MNAIDYFFENTYQLEKPFLVGKEEISYKDLYSSYIHIAKWINEMVGKDKHIILLSVNNLFFLKMYLAIIKSGNICIPLDPGIEKENYRYIHDLTEPKMIFLTREVEKRLELNSELSWFPDTLPVMHDSFTPETTDGEFDREKCAEIIFTSGSTGKPKG